MQSCHFEKILRTIDSEWPMLILPNHLEPFYKICIELLSFYKIKKKYFLKNHESLGPAQNIVLLVITGVGKSRFEK